jgi:hypothetical protein
MFPTSFFDFISDFSNEGWRSGLTCSRPLCTSVELLGQPTKMIELVAAVLPCPGLMDRVFTAQVLRVLHWTPVPSGGLGRHPYEGGARGNNPCGRMG